MQDPQILEALELLMPEKNNANTDVHASSEEDTNVGEERIQPGPLRRTQPHVDVDNLDDVRMAGTDGSGLTASKTMFDSMEVEFEGSMDDEKIWEATPKEVRGDAWTRRVCSSNQR
jgi:hypothetical protein